MTVQNLNERLHRRPFVPFRIHLSGGTFYDILHPEMMLVSKTGVVVALYQPGEEIAERTALLSLLHITSTEDLQPRSVA